MREFKGCANYTLISTEKLNDINSVAYILKHDKTGARVCLIQNDDDNKSFMIGFRTIPTDSTGVPHILEHSVLGGSERYPVKDAMTEVGKGSLNTFMNAFTYGDRTLYPVASCNDKDFHNLFMVYCDAVFKPNVYNNPNTFKQEGWHYEMEDSDSELTINGVVYNEMKGVFSSPESVCNYETNFSLFPDTQYGLNSGGDPKFIPDLTYESFLEFHSRLYHPSNSRIYLYGDMDFEEKLTYLDKEYLSKYDAIDPNTEISLQKAFEKPVRLTKEYSLGEEENEKDATFLTYNVVCSKYDELEINHAMDVINYALCTVAGAKLKERLIDAGIGQDVYSEYATDLGQLVFSIIAQNANPEDEDKFVEIIENTMAEIIEEGFDRKTLEASITTQEFSYREADFGYYPRGILYGMYVFDTWTYTDEDILHSLKQNAVFKSLREHLNDDFYERVLEERVLKNPHKSIVKIVPVKGLSKAEDEKLAKKLAEYKATLSAEEIEKIVKDTKELKEYQDAPDSPEALATIPTLSINDISKDIREYDFKETEYEGVKFVETETFTNGIAYFTLSFAIDKLPQNLLPYLSIAKIILGQANTRSYKYGELVNEIAICTGSLNVGGITVYRDGLDTNKFHLAFDVKSKVFYNRIPDAFRLIEEIIFSTDFDDKKRIKDILQETKTRIQGYAISSGHAVALLRANSYFSESGVVSEILSGMDQARLIEKLCDNYDDMIDDFVANMKETLKYIIAKDGLVVSIGAEKEGIEIFKSAFSDFLKKIPSEILDRQSYDFTAVKKQEAFTSASKVQYVCLSGNYMKHDLPYTGSLPVLRNILSSDYLWNAVRLQGGAYGVMCSFGRTGDSFMVSYRDPNLSKTLDAYHGAVEYIKNFADDEGMVERFVISSIGDLDSPLTPSMRVFRNYTAYWAGLTNETLKKERDELLSTNSQTVREMAKYLEAFMEDNCICCVGGEEAIDKDKDLFLSISPLTNS